MLLKPNQAISFKQYQSRQAQLEDEVKQLVEALKVSTEMLEDAQRVMGILYRELAKKIGQDAVEKMLEPTNDSAA